MRIRALLILALWSVPALTFAQSGPLDCSDCMLGLYDQPDMLTNFGSVTPFVPKDIYLGIRNGTSTSGLAVVEFSVAGMRQGEDGILVMSVDGITSPLPNIILGTLPAPADTASTSTQTGGMDVAWPECIEGSQSLLRISFMALAPLQNKVFRVMHRFPPTNPTFGRTKPMIFLCDDPYFTAVRVPGGCYIANDDGTTPVACPRIDQPVAATPGTWGTVKNLYR